MNFLYLLPVLASALLFVVAALAIVPDTKRSDLFFKGAEGAGLITFLMAIGATATLFSHGAGTSMLLGLGDFGFSARIDVISATMFCLVSFIGWIVLRYSRSYLQGDANQKFFIGWMAATLASVLMVVSSGNLFQLAAFWILTSLFLHKLLLFYPDRQAAVRAARKKFVIARVGDVTMVGACMALYLSFSTTDIATILTVAKTGDATLLVILATVLVAVSAILKSAQFPTHGWLTEVMEAPTPVSALLHAGVINAGGFLLIRFADVMLLAPGVLATLAMIGGFTALFGGAVMLTQSAVKTSLAWSTVSQMGFMVMQCGLALFPLALLHIVAHSLYKAHAFLGSGTAVELVSKNRQPGPVAVPNGKAVLRAFVAALVIYGCVGLGFGFDGKSPQAIALGAILIFGVAYLIAQGLADDAPRALTIRTSIYALAASISYFTLQEGINYLSGAALPKTPAPGPLEWALIVLALLSFGLVALAQSTFPLWAHHPATAGLRVHLANGLYFNAMFDRLIGGWATTKTHKTS
ncbi:proton-conducting transporter transmembrane domain-containing protein [Sneathiella aquimaris]|uniref:proton-conducting transporter transmembrane domain-containing protein n=1 Tax=Sneathiella aquimaris TaxID=2599305 RepID=UPI00146B257E|nr:proton-conducting transporter membrane subunit [Sneathiella aquimaris]